MKPSELVWDYLTRSGQDVRAEVREAFADALDAVLSPADANSCGDLIIDVLAAALDEAAATPERLARLHALLEEWAEDPEPSTPAGP